MATPPRMCLELMTCSALPVETGRSWAHWAALQETPLHVPAQVELKPGEHRSLHSAGSH